MIRWSACMVCSLLLVSVSMAQRAESTDPESDQRADELFAQFVKTGKALDFSAANGDENYSFLEKPVLKFSSEGTVFGSVHIWFDNEKRLAAIGTIGSLPINGAEMEFIELHLLKPQPIKPMSIPGFPPKRWNPDVSELALRPIAGAPQVGTNLRTRLIQMRALARQFNAKMKNNGQVHQLRLLPQPLYRYQDPTSERAGALFAFVWDTGTDPEVVLRVEAKEQDGNVLWHYQPIRFTWRELDLRHKDQNVWHRDEFLDRDSPNQNTPYITGLTQRL